MFKHEPIDLGYADLVSCTKDTGRTYTTPPNEHGRNTYPTYALRALELIKTVVLYGQLLESHRSALNISLWGYKTISPNNLKLGTFFLYFYCKLWYNRTINNKKGSKK